MKAARERAIQDKGGLPLEEGEKWLLTTKACHDLLNDRAEYRRRLVAHETKEEELKMVRRGKKTLTGDLVCEIMTDTMAHRLLRDDETGLGGKNLRQELLKRESEIGDVAKVVMAANRFRRKGRVYGESAAERRAKKRREKEDVPRYGYPTFTYREETEDKISSLENNENHHGQPSHTSSQSTIAITGEQSEDQVPKKENVGDLVLIESSNRTSDGVETLQSLEEEINESLCGAGSSKSETAGTTREGEMIDSTIIRSDANETTVIENEAENHHLQVLNRFKQAAHKELSRKKLRDCRLRMILPVGDEDTKEQIFWEKVGVPRVIPGMETKEKDELEEKPKTLHWWEKDSSVESHNTQKSVKTTSDETLMQTNAKIRMNREMGWRPGLLRHVDVVDDDPSDWMRRARQQRTVAKRNDPLEHLFWEKEGKPPLPDPFSISEEVSQFLNLNKSNTKTNVENKVISSERDSGEESEEEEEIPSRGFKGTFKWVEELVDTSSGSSGGMSGTSKSRPDGRVHHTLTVFPACWAPSGRDCVDWLRPGMSLVFMFGGRRFVQPPPARRGDPSKGRYRPSPTVPTNELWSYTPQLYKWQNLTDYCKGKGAGPRSRHTTAIARGEKSAVNLLIFGGLDLHNNAKNDLFLLDLTTLCWTEVQLRGVPPPNGLGAACMTETGKDIIVTKDRDVAAETDAERKNGIPSAMGVWRLKLSSAPEEKYSAKQVWLGLWSRAPRRLPPHGAGHTITTLGRSQVVFGGLAAKTGDVVSMSLGSLKVLGKGSGFGNPLLEENSADKNEKKYEIVQGRRRNRERKLLRMRKNINGLGGEEGEDSMLSGLNLDDEEDEDWNILKGSEVNFEKHLEPFPMRLGKGAGALGQRLIATPDPKRAIRYNRIAGSEEDGRFRNPIRDGMEPGCLGLVPVNDVSKVGMRKLLCAPDNRISEIKMKSKKERHKAANTSQFESDVDLYTQSSDSYEVSGSSSGGGIDVGGSSLDDWLRITEKASEDSGGLGGRGRDHDEMKANVNRRVVQTAKESPIKDTVGHLASIGNISYSSGDNKEDELTLVHHQAIPSHNEKARKVSLVDAEEQAYDLISAHEEESLHSHHTSIHTRDDLEQGANQSSTSYSQTHLSAAAASSSSKSEFGKGAVWEPASWIRPWAKAGIRRLVEPPRRQYHAAVAVSKRHLVVCGGELGGSLNKDVSEDSEFRYRVSSGVYLLDLQTSEWSQLPVSNPVRRAGHALVCVDGKLLSFGGRSAPLPATKPFPMDLLYLEYDG